MNDEEYTNALAWASAQIVAAVHRGEQTGPFIKAALDIEPPAGKDRIGLLINMVAAQVDPNTTLSERLAWTNQLHPDVIAACQRRAS